MSAIHTAPSKSIGLTSPLCASAVALATAAYTAASANATPLLITLAALAVSGFTAQRSSIGSLPRYVSGSLIIIAMIYAAYVAIAREVDVSIVCNVLVAVTILKLFERRTSRDHAHLLILSTSLLVGSILLDPVFAVSLIAIAFVPLLTLAALALQIAAARERAATPHARSTRAPLATVWASVLAIGLPMVAFVFIMVPRGIGQDALFRFAGITPSIETGMTDRVQLGESGVINESQRRVLELRVTDELGASQGSPSRTFYLRGAVLERKPAGQWEPISSQLRQIDMSATRSRRTWPYQQQTIRPLTYEISFARPRASGRVRLFTPWQTVEFVFPNRCVLIERRKTSTLEIQGEFERIEYIVKATRPDSAFPLPYRTSSQITAPPFALDYATNLLEDANLDPTPRDRDQVTTRRIARLIQSHFQDEFGYNHVQLRPPPDTDPLEWFLNDRRQGHCEYFAAAMVTLCHALGIDARMVTGYVAVEFDETREVYVVREANAHAWVEVHVGEGVWETFDPTPPADLQATHQPERTFFSSIVDSLRSFETFWSTTVMGFGEGDQRQLFAAEQEDQGRAIIEQSEQRKGVLSQLTPFIAPLAIAATVIGLVALAFNVRKPAHTRVRTKLDRILRRADQRLARRFRPRRPWETPLEFANALQLEDPHTADRYRDLVTIIYEARFAPTPPPDAHSMAHAALDAITAAPTRHPAETENTRSPLPQTV